jgi:hypothetical protein
MIYHSQGKHATHFTTDAVICVRLVQSVTYKNEVTVTLTLNVTIKKVIFFVLWPKFIILCMCVYFDMAVSIKMRSLWPILSLKCQDQISFFFYLIHLVYMSRWMQRGQEYQFVSFAYKICNSRLLLFIQGNTTHLVLMYALLF